MGKISQPGNVVRIDFLINKMMAGGAERVISLLANHLCQDPKYKVRIITFQGSDAYALDERVERVRLHRIFLFRSVIFNGFFNLMWFYRKRKNRPDVVSSHIDLLGYLTIPVAFFYRIPLIVSEHNNHKAYNSVWQKFLWNVLYKFPKAVTILTRYDQAFFAKKNPKVVVMPNPCTFPVIEDTEALERRKEIIAIGSLTRFHQKGFDNLIQIAGHVLPEFPDWKLRIIGGGDQGLDFLSNLANQFQVSDQIVFEGVRNDVRDILKQAEIFILPSRFEGLPMVLLEAMSQGITCISYDCISGPSDIISNGVNGILVPDQDQEAMVKALSDLMRNSKQRLLLRKAAPKAVESYSLEQVGRQWKSLIHEVLS